jgi:hypothetical protein
MLIPLQQQLYHLMLWILDCTTRCEVLKAKSNSHE